MESLSDLIDRLNAENKKLKEKVEELSTKIEALKSELKEEMPKGEIWKPKDNEKYWYVGEFGEVWSSVIDTENYTEVGNCYPTEEKAEFEAQREKYTRLFRQYVEQHSEPLNWEDCDEEKWYVYYNMPAQEIRVDSLYYCKGMGVYGSSEEVMRDAVAFIGEENFLRYVIGVEENNDNT